MITIIPAIDVIDGQCVRLRQGDFKSKTIYADDPLEMAQRFEKAGIQRLHLVDLDGAKQRQIVNATVLHKIAAATRLQIDFGGGVQSDADIAKAFECGARQITAGSVAVKNPQMVRAWIERYGAHRIILGADVRDNRIAISGWQEASTLNLDDFIRQYSEQGIQTVICTDISRDGQMQGPAFNLYKRIKNEFPNLEVIASGGVTHIDDIRRLSDTGIDGVIIGKALYENKIQLHELEPFLC